MQRLQLRQKPGIVHSLGRCVEQRELGRHQLALDPLRVLQRQRGIQIRRAHAELSECTDLIVHQRDQRADHQRDALAVAVARDRGNLIAETLAAARRHQHQRVATARDVLDDFALRATKSGITEDLAENVQRIRRRHVGRRIPRAGTPCAL
jgi:hypothetical protein